MDDFIGISNETLWSVLSGTSVLYSDAIVGRQLEAARAKFAAGLLHYSGSAAPTPTPTPTPVPAAQRQLVGKIAKLIDVSEAVAWELLCAYLVGGFRGTARSLAALLSSERHQQPLLLSIWRFYHTERLYLLLCLRQVIAHHDDTAHPYHALFSGFLDVLDSSSSSSSSSGAGGRLLDSLLDQLSWAAAAPAPGWRQPLEALSSPAAQQAWVGSALRELTELLQCLLAYCQHRRPAQPRHLRRLLTITARHGFGRSPAYSALLTEQHASLVTAVGALETALLLHCLQLDAVAAQAGGCPLASEHALTTGGGWQQLDSTVGALGGRPEHGPVLLGWALMLMAVEAQPARVRTLAKRCRQLDVLKHLRQMLTDVELLSNRSSTVGKVVRSAVYNLMNLLLLNFDAGNLGAESDLVTICAEVLAVPELADHFWTAQSGVRLLLDDLLTRFPADAEPVLELCAALAEAGDASLDQVVSLLLRLPSYAEPAASVPAGSFTPSQDGSTWQLHAARALPELQLPAGTEGRLLLGAAGRQLVCWQRPHSGWQETLIMLDDLLMEGCQGDQYIQPETARRAAAVARLVAAVLAAAGAQLARQLAPHVQLLLALLERHCGAPARPAPFLHHTADAVALYARVEPQTVWESVECNRLLPLAGACGPLLETVSGGRLGELIESQECVQRTYPLTRAFLRLLLNVVKSESGCKRAGLDASVAFVLRDVVPAQARWQFARASEQTQLAADCLQLCHALLTPADRGQSPLRALVTQALTEGAAAETLLQLVVHGEARIAALLEEQAHWDTGGALQYMRLVQVALSVLNRLLSVRASQSDDQLNLLERLLTSQPASRHQPRPLLAVAQYLFHRHNPHLPTLAVRLLNRLAKVFPLSLLASFGRDSEVICAALLGRLRSETDDVNLKVAILDFIGTCVGWQPGLLQRLIVGPGASAPEEKDKTKNADDEDDEPGFLEELVDILEDHEKSQRWDSALLGSAAALVHALWRGQCAAALQYLRGRRRFWPALAAGLTTAPAHLPLALAAHLVRTLALELYYTPAAGADPAFTKLMHSVTGDGGKMLHSWSQLVRRTTGALAADLDSSMMAAVAAPESDAERQQDAAHLLLAWRDFCLVAASASGSGVSVPLESQRRLIVDVAASLAQQLTADRRPRLVNTLAELLMCLTQRWSQRCGDGEVQRQVWALLEACAEHYQELPGRARAAIITTALHVLQHCPAGSQAERDASERCAEPACRLLEQSLVETEPEPAAAAALQAAGLSAQLLRRLTLSAPARRQLATQMPLTVAAVLTLVGRRLRAARQPQLCQQLLQLVTTAATVEPAAARAAAALGLSSCLCLPLADLRQQLAGELAGDWRPVWVLCVHLWTALLRSQRHFFCTDAVDFAAVHAAALAGAVAQLRTTLQDADLQVAEAAVGFLATLAAYSEQWRRQHAGSLQSLLPWLGSCAGVCFWYVGRPSIVALLLERPHTLAGTQELKRVRRLSSTDPEPERAPPQVTRVQNRLVRLASVCVSALLSLSPPLPLLLTQDGLHLQQWRRLVGASCASPTLDRPGPLPLTYGTLLAGVAVCVRPLAKSERWSPGRGASTAGDAPPTSPAPSLERAALTTLLQRSLTLILSQAALHLLQPGAAAATGADADADAQPLNRDTLHGELTSLLESLRRQLRRSGSTGGHSPLPARSPAAGAGARSPLAARLAAAPASPSPRPARAAAAVVAPSPLTLTTPVAETSASDLRFVQLMEHIANTVLAA